MARDFGGTAIPVQTLCRGIVTESNHNRQQGSTTGSETIDMAKPIDMASSTSDSCGLAEFSLASRGQVCNPASRKKAAESRAPVRSRLVALLLQRQLQLVPGLDYGSLPLACRARAIGVYAT